MKTQTSTPLWLDLKIDYIDENFNKVFNYIYQNFTTKRDPFYDITINLLEKRIDSLVQEYQDQQLLYDENLALDKDKLFFTARLLGLYLLSVDNSAKNYRTAFVLFAYILALLEPRNISMSYVANTLKFVFGTLPSKSILEWNDIEHFYPEIVAHKLNVAMSSKAGYTKSDCFEMMGTLQLISKRLQLAATNRVGITQSYTSSLSIVDDIIQIVTPKSEKLKQSKSSDIDNIKEFTFLFIADQRKVSRKLKKYTIGSELTVRLVSKKNNHLQVVSTNKEYQQIQGEVRFSKNFFFYNEQDFIDAINIDDEFDVVYQGEDVFDIKSSFLTYTKDYLYEQGAIVGAKAVMVTKERIGWGTETGFGVYTPYVEGVNQGDCAEIKLKLLLVDKDGSPTGWINGEMVQIINEDIDYDNAKYEAIANGFVYEKEEGAKTVTILSATLIKTIYRLLVFGQQHCVSNPTDRYKILSVCQMLAVLIGKEDDVVYIEFLSKYLENLVHFAKSEYAKIDIPSFSSEQKVDGIVRREQIVSILKAYGSITNAEVLDDVIDNMNDPLLVKIATLVQSCNRLEDVINPSMQNVIKREIIASLSVETEGDTDLEEDNGIYLGIENNRQEFKTSFFHAPQTAKEQRQHINVFKGVCAFLNTTDGGTLYLGVNDLGYVQGIDAEIAYLQTITYGNYKGIDGFMRYITDQAKQYFDIDVVANINIRPMYENKVLAMEISPYEFGIVKLEDIAYLRVNAESVAINEAAIQRISGRKNLSVIKKDSTVEELSKAIRSQHCVILHNYQSSNSGNIRDRKVEVFDFTDNGASIWCYDLEKKDVRLFNIARIGYVEVTKQLWANQDKHKCGNIDIFNMTGSASIDVCLRLNLRAKNLLIEEFPRSKDYVVKENNNSWLLTTKVYNIAGVARFYIGLANSIQIVSSPELTEYIKEYCKTYLKV